MNMIDYLEWRGDITFREKELNEVDNLIFSTIVYLKMEELISSDDSMTIGEIYRACEEAGMDTSDYACDPKPVLKVAAESERFKDVDVKWYVSRFDSERQVQFAAATFVYGKGKAYVAFRGTDKTLTGWREDCNFSYKTETPGQKAAVDYLKFVAKQMKGSLIVGGHSKGGNFAAYASAFCGKRIRDSRIVQIYSNDGPGFITDIAESPEYAAILGKLKKIIPEFSIVGILLSSKAERKVITSNGKGALQHNPYTWNVKGTAFETADNRSLSSVMLDDALSSWISSLSSEDRQQLVDSIFDVLEASGAETLSDISNQKAASFFAMLKAASQLKKKGELAETLGRLIAAGKDTIVAGAMKGFDKFILGDVIQNWNRITGGESRYKLIDGNIIKLYEGRPKDPADRLPREIRTYDFLDSLGIRYQRTDHEAANNMEACNAIDEILGVVICKNLFLCNRQKTRFYLLMMPGDKKFKTKELSGQIGSSRLSFAEPEDMLKYLDIEPGAVSIMGLMNDHDHAVQLIIDEDVLQDEYVGCHPCVSTSSLKLKTKDLTDKFLPATGHNYIVVELKGED